MAQAESRKREEQLKIDCELAQGQLELLNQAICHAMICRDIPM